MGVVPVAATLNVADCPAAIVAPTGCDEIVGATAGPVEDGPVPVPLSTTEIVVPLPRLNSSVPE
jgi:hypothetical protein